MSKELLFHKKKLFTVEMKLFKYSTKKVLKKIRYPLKIIKRMEEKTTIAESV